MISNEQVFVSHFILTSINFVSHHRVLPDIAEANIKENLGFTCKSCSRSVISCLDIYFAEQINVDRRRDCRNQYLLPVLLLALPLPVPCR